MLHRAIVGSLERFIGILIENHAGAMPTWLAPTQVVVMNISDNSAEYAKKVTQNLKKQGFRVHCDLRNEKITYKIRDHALQKHPYLVVVGDKEQENNLVAVRARGGIDLGVMTIDAFEKKLTEDVHHQAQH
jgi:threonyl-tRNA synthetase